MLNQSVLNGFSGSESFYKHWLAKIYYTEGVKYLCDNGGSWLLDVIASYQNDPKIKKNPSLQQIQFWKLKVDLKTQKGIVTCVEDTDIPPAIKQEIPFTDFPLEEVEIFVEYGSVDGVNSTFVAMLPGER